MGYVIIRYTHHRDAPKNVKKKRVIFEIFDAHRCKRKLIGRLTDPQNLQKRFSAASETELKVTIAYNQERT